MDAGALLHDPVDDLPELFFHLVWRMGSGFFYINCPVFIQRIGEIYPDARELGGFVFWNQPEPVPPGHQPVISVNIYPLITDKLAAALIIVMLFQRKLAVMGKNIRLNPDFLTGNSDDFLGE